MFFDISTEEKATTESQKSRNSLSRRHRQHRTGSSSQQIVTPPALKPILPPKPSHRLSQVQSPPKSEAVVDAFQDVLGDILGSDYSFSKSDANHPPAPPPVPSVQRTNRLSLGESQDKSAFLKELLQSTPPTPAYDDSAVSGDPSKKRSFRSDIESIERKSSEATYAAYLAEKASPNEGNNSIDDAVVPVANHITDDLDLPDRFAPNPQPDSNSIVNTAKDPECHLVDSNKEIADTGVATKKGLQETVTAVQEEENQPRKQTRATILAKRFENWNTTNGHSREFEGSFSPVKSDEKSPNLKSRSPVKTRLQQSTPSEVAQMIDTENTGTVGDSGVVLRQPLTPSSGSPLSILDEGISTNSSQFLTNGDHSKKPNNGGTEANPRPMVSTKARLLLHTTPPSQHSRGGILRRYSSPVSTAAINAFRDKAALSQPRGSVILDHGPLGTTVTRTSITLHSPTPRDKQVPKAPQPGHRVGSPETKPRTLTEPYDVSMIVRPNAFNAVSKTAGSTFKPRFTILAAKAPSHRQIPATQFSPERNIIPAANADHVAGRRRTPILFPKPHMNGSVPESTVMSPASNLLYKSPSSTPRSPDPHKGRPKSLDYTGPTNGYSPPSSRLNRSSTAPAQDIPSVQRASNLPVNGYPPSPSKSSPSHSPTKETGLINGVGPDEIPVHVRRDSSSDRKTLATRSTNRVRRSTEHSSCQNWDPRLLLNELYKVKYDVPEERPRSVRYTDMEGFLEHLPVGVRSGVMDTIWRSHYFRTQSGKLAWFDNEAALELSLGEINLAGTDIDVDKERSRLSIHGGTDGTYLIIKCPAEDLDDWRHALVNHSALSTPETFVRPVYPPLPDPDQNLIIIELGSCSIRAGRLSMEPSLPSLFFPAVAAVADPNTPQSSIVGCEAYAPDARMDKDHLVFPITATQPGLNRYSMDLPIVSQIFSKIFTDLDLPGADYKVLLSLPQNSPPNLIADLVRLLLKDHKVQSVAFAKQPILVLYAYDVTTGIVLDIGDRLNIVPVTDGYVVQTGMISLPYGGYKVAETLRTKLSDCNSGLYTFVSPVEKLILRYVMERTSYMALDYQSECKKFLQASSEKHHVNVSIQPFEPLEEMMSEFTVDSAQFTSTEGYMKPKHWGLDITGLDKLILSAVQASPIDSRRNLYKNIYLCGGATLIPGLADRLEAELSKQVASSIHVRVHTSPWRYHAAYLGAQVLGNSAQIEQQMVTLNSFDSFVTQLYSSPI